MRQECKTCIKMQYCTIMGQYGKEYLLCPEWSKEPPPKPVSLADVEDDVEVVGIKYDGGKPRLAEMIQDFRLPLIEVAKVWAFGADKYDKRPFI